jgi:mannose-1-phosphate guanylyltransferase
LKALILAGGFGTRMRPLSCTRPKILFPIINKPLLEWIFEQLIKSEIRELVLAVDRQTEFFIKPFLKSEHRLKIHFSVDPPQKPLGTGGPIKKAETILGHDSPFLVLNGDIFSDMNYQEILNRDKEQRTAATICLHKVEDPSRYGVAELGDSNRITRFIEKPIPKEAPTNLINAGIYVLSPEIFDYIPKEKRVSLERDVFPLLAKNRKLYGHVHDGLWTDTGKPEEYLKVNKILLDSPQHSQKTHQLHGKGKIKNPTAIGEEVHVGEGSLIGPYAVLGRNVIIKRNVQIKDSVIFSNVEVHNGSIIEGAIIGENTIIGKKVRIRKGCIIGDNVKVRGDVSLAEGVSICPGKEVSNTVLESSNII